WSRFRSSARTPTARSARLARQSEPRPAAKRLRTCPPTDSSGSVRTLLDLGSLCFSVSLRDIQADDALEIAQVHFLVGNRRRIDLAVQLVQDLGPALLLVALGCGCGHDQLAGDGHDIEVAVRQRQVAHWEAVGRPDFLARLGVNAADEGRRIVLAGAAVDML